MEKFNTDCRMTNRIVAGKRFQENNMVLVDVGARGGVPGYWKVNYRDQLSTIGFEPDAEAYDELKKQCAGTKESYYPYFLSSKKGKKTFYNAYYPSSSGFYKNIMSFWERFPAKFCLEIIDTDEVDVIDLNSVARENDVGNIDFMKIDVEGAELDVLEGATDFLGSDGMLGVEMEVRFLNTANQPEFSEVDRFMRANGFFLYDLDLSRYTKSALTQVFKRDSQGKIIAHATEKGQLIGGDALYLRDAVGEMKSDSSNDKAWSDTRILKLASLMELFNLNDCSIELLQYSQSEGKLEGVDVDALVDLLTPRFGFKTIPYKQYMENIENGQWQADKVEALRQLKLYLEYASITLLPGYVVGLLRVFKKTLAAFKWLVCKLTGR